ncbi:MAG TPA: BadF/BadG/BcrA/BcrD ATPase family protein [Lacipirellulaceae bacterium]|nr:BadF/BadG/BcrA/BcrD ATPase family protein [Lacipirellulaceae bacterium]
MASIPEHRDAIANSPDDLLLAVDAGGTKTAAWLVDLNGPESHRVLGRGRAGAGNPLSVGFDEATRAVTAAIVAARNEANYPGKCVGRLILSIAGAANESVGKQFVDWVRSLGLAERVAVVSDVLPVLAAGTPHCVGVAVIAGTGSVAFGRNAGGKTQLCGGWGYLLGDEGSGYFVGQSALRHALNNLERQSVADPLTAAVTGALGASSIMDVTKAVYTSADPRATIASLAPIVVEVADEYGAEAEAILDGAGDLLAGLVARTADLLDLTDKPFALAVAGGLLGGSKRVREKLQSWLESAAMQCDMTIINEPLEGCVRLAAPEFAGTLVKWM